LAFFSWVVDAGTKVSFAFLPILVGVIKNKLESSRVKKLVRIIVKKLVRIIVKKLVKIIVKMTVAISNSTNTKHKLETSGNSNCFKLD
jgi:hypothetical protein